MHSLIVLSLCLAASAKRRGQQPLKTVVNSVRYGKDCGR